MTDYTYVSLGFLVVFIISTIILCREVKKYYKEKRELARTNDMYISTISILSDKGLACGAVSACSLIMLILIYFKHSGYKWAIPILEQIGIL